MHIFPLLLSATRLHLFLLEKLQSKEKYIHPLYFSVCFRFCKVKMKNFLFNLRRSDPHSLILKAISLRAARECTQCKVSCTAFTSSAARCELNLLQIFSKVQSESHLNLKYFLATRSDSLRPKLRQGAFSACRCGAPPLAATSFE
jgi:hypothetical protein